MTTIITKNSSTASAVPLAADLVQGELAVNVTDKRLFTQNASDVVVELGTNPSSITTASATVTGGAVNNTPVGASTPSTGAFTTLSATGLITTNGQVKFPSSQNASADANTLDDYEEGTCSLSLYTSSGTITSYTSVAKYVKVGRQVTITGAFLITNNGTGAGTLYVSGLPFIPSGDACGAGRNGGTTGYLVSLVVSNGSATLACWDYANNYAGGTNANLQFSVTYQTT